MEKVHLKLTMPQAKKLMKGGVIQLKPEALRDNSHYLILEKKTATKVKRAKRAGKGCRVQLSPQEMSHCGEGIGDFFKNAFSKVKEGSKWVKSNVIDTPFYQSSVKPLVRQGVNAALAMATPELGVLTPAAIAAANKFGEYSGAYGLKEDFAKFGKRASDFYQTHAKKYVAPHLRKAVQSAEQALVSRAKRMAPQFANDIDKLHEEYGERAISEIGNRTGAFGLRKGRGLKSDYSNFLSPDSEAMRPIAASLPAIGGWVYFYPMDRSKLAVETAAPKKRRLMKRGGSFKPSGGSFMPSG